MMSDPQRWKQRHNAKARLKHARQMLPTRLIEHGRDANGTVATVEAYEECILHDELERALEQLWMLGLLNNCSGGYWRTLERVALELGLKEGARFLRDEMNAALERTTFGSEST